MHTNAFPGYPLNVFPAPVAEERVLQTPRQGEIEGVVDRLGRAVDALGGMLEKLELRLRPVLSAPTTRAPLTEKEYTTPLGCELARICTELEIAANGLGDQMSRLEL
jgi:hypothetical protein